MFVQDLYNIFAFNVASVSWSYGGSSSNPKIKIYIIWRTFRM